MSNDLVDTVHCLPFQDTCALLPDESVDLVLVDPPYEKGLDTWDNAVNIPLFMEEVRRVLKPTGWLAFFGQMPSLIEWCSATGNVKGLKYREHIVWAKRMTTTTNLALNHNHESLMLYSRTQASYQQSTGLFTDIKLAHFLDGLLSIDSLERYIAELHYAIRHGGHRKTMSGGRLEQHVKRGIGSVHYETGNEEVNFTTLWSFLPQSSTQNNQDIDHPSIKPTKLLNRLIRLLTCPNALVLDCFCGSGSTGVACIQTGRNYVLGDTSAEYIALTQRRLNEPIERSLFA